MTSSRDRNTTSAESTFDKGELISLKEYDERVKLDDYILGVAVALCAFMAKTNAYGPVGFNPETVLILSLGVVAMAAACGFSRRRYMIRFLGALSNEMTSGAKQTSSYEDKSQRYLRRAACKERLRNYLLALGLALYVMARVWESYGQHGWIPVP
jgi:hypothetical protein